MKIFRIEHEDGHGIFRPKGVRDGIRDISELETLYKRHISDFPNPAQDGIMSIRDKEFCAFKSLPQLLENVLVEEIPLLIKYGFRIYELHVSNHVIRQGQKQVVFMKKGIIAKRDITDSLIPKTEE